jgi:hypothetical protein
MKNTGMRVLYSFASIPFEMILRLNCSQIFEGIRCSMTFYDAVLKNALILLGMKIISHI